MTTGNSVGLKGCASLYARPAQVSEDGKAESSHMASLAKTARTKGLRVVSTYSD